MRNFVSFWVDLFRVFSPTRQPIKDIKVLGLSFCCLATIATLKWKHMFVVWLVITVGCVQLLHLNSFNVLCFKRFKVETFGISEFNVIVTITSLVQIFFVVCLVI